MLAPMIEQIKEVGFAVDGHLISYFSYTDKNFVVVAKDPLAPSKTIPADNLVSDQRLILKFRPPAPGSALAANKNSSSAMMQH